MGTNPAIHPTWNCELVIVLVEPQLENIGAVIDAYVFLGYMSYVFCAMMVNFLMNSGAMAFKAYLMIVKPPRMGHVL